MSSFAGTRASEQPILHTNAEGRRRVGAVRAWAGGLRRAAPGAGTLTQHVHASGRCLRAGRAGSQARMQHSTKPIRGPLKGMHATRWGHMPTVQHAHLLVQHIAKPAIQEVGQLGNAAGGPHPRCRPLGTHHSTSMSEMPTRPLKYSEFCCSLFSDQDLHRGRRGGGWGRRRACEALRWRQAAGRGGGPSCRKCNRATRALQSLVMMSRPGLRHAPVAG